MWLHNIISGISMQFLNDKSQPPASVLESLDQNAKSDFLLALSIEIPALFSNWPIDVPPESQLNVFCEHIRDYIQATCSSKILTLVPSDQWECQACTRWNLKTDKECQSCSYQLERTASGQAAEMIALEYERQEIQSKQDSDARLARELDEEEWKLQREFDCPVCLNPEASIDGSYQLNCQHRVCNTCLMRYITNKIDSNEVAEGQLCCPYVRCECTIVEQTIRYFLSFITI